MISFAWFVLFSWPVVSIILYRTFSLPVALVTTLLGGYLLLPNVIGLDLPLLPPLDKTSIPTVTAVILTAIYIAKAPAGTCVLPGWLPQSPLMRLLVAIFFIGVLGTFLTNTDPLVYGWRVLPGLGVRDMISELLRSAIVLAPIFLARRVLATHDSQRLLLVILVLACVIYSFFALYEVRMSPHLHSTFYGFFPHSFLQHMRAGGFRPLVFLNHGLALGMLLACALIAAIILFRTSGSPIRERYGIAILLLAVTLLFAKTLGALMIAVIIAPIVLFLNARLQLVVATSIAMIVITYPLLRSADLVPVQQLLTFAERVDPARASSLGTRFANEDALLDKIDQKPLFGWGGYGRNRTYTEFGDDGSLTDGAWILILSTGGWARYIVVFGFFCFPIIFLWRTRGQALDPVCVGLALILSAKLVDLLPNAGIDTIYLLMAGSLIGRLELESKGIRPHLSKTADMTEEPSPDMSQGYAAASHYTRQRVPKHTRALSNSRDVAKTQIERPATRSKTRRNKYVQTPSNNRTRR